MKISIITVTYNSALTIKETLESVKEQTYPNVEHIVIDGKSQDDTLAILKVYGSLSKVVSEPDYGIYDAMNKGVSLATGDIVGILNSDDIFESKDTLSHVVDCFIKNPATQAVFGNISYFNTGQPDKIVRYWKTKPFYPRFFENGNMPPHPSLFVKKIVYDSIGLYKEKYKICADQEFFIRMLKVNSVRSIYTDETIVKMRLGGVSTSGFRSYLLTTRESIIAWKDNGLTYPWYLLFIRPITKIKQLFFKV
jgi:glycosyltransferase involved in cell wall biosynthesis